MRETLEHSQPRDEGRTRSLRILAKSVYRELKASGYDRTDVVRFTNEVLALVTDEMRDDSELHGS